MRRRVWACMGLRLRGSLQGEAEFYEATYRELTRYRTRARRMSEHESGMAGLWFLWELADLGTDGSLAVRLSGDAVGWNYRDFVAPSLSITGGAALERLGWVVGVVSLLGLEVEL